MNFYYVFSATNKKKNPKYNSNSSEANSVANPQESLELLWQKTKNEQTACFEKHDTNNDKCKLIRVKCRKYDSFHV